jgi:alpha-beta hydrolase superfamily lysophospholipase
MNWFRRFLGAGVSGVALGLLAGVVTFTAPAFAAPKAFYVARDEELPGPPGSVIRMERFGGSVWGSTSYRVLYRSTGLDGQPIAVSGVIIVPSGTDTHGTRPVLAWAHPTTGVARGCAPSLRGTAMLGTIPGLAQIIQRGFVIAATDYPGLGTKGPHPYLIGISEARAVLDSVRAARSISGAGDSFAVWGHSQGGHAALWTGELASSYAPELKLMGVAAAAPATLLGQLFENDLGTLAGVALTAMTLEAWSDLYRIPIESAVLPQAIANVHKIGDSCITKFSGLVATKEAIDGMHGAFLKVNPVTTPPWAGIITANVPGQKPAGAPIFISQGLADTVVDPPVTAEFFKILCAQGARVRLLEIPGVSHTNIAMTTAGYAVSWIADRFDRRPAPNNCR